MRTLLVDGDMVAWLAALSTTRVDEYALRIVDRYRRDLCGDRVIIALSDPSRRYWRHELFEGYKPSRSEQPAAFGFAREALQLNHITRTLPAMEADDVMGILATHPAIAGEVVMVANDKDLLTVPGLHFNPRKPDDGIVEVSDYAADLNHLRQTLVGDPGDGYPGARGIGPKTADRLLRCIREQWWTQVVLAFKRHGASEQDALLQARLARICRADDFDYATKQVRLWSPAVAGAMAAGGAM